MTFLDLIRSRALTAGLLATTLTLGSSPSHAVDTDAGDYVPLPEGSSLGLVYYQYADRNRQYRDGDRLAGHRGMTSQIGILRGVHFTRLGKYIVDPQFLLPFGHMEGRHDTSALGTADGIGDLTLAATVWLVNRPEDRTWFGITPFLYLPTGRYDHDRPLNLGENRWKFALQAGYITGLSERLFLDLIGDVTLFGKNDEFGSARDDMDQDPMFQLQTWLRYQLNDGLDLRAGLSHSFGGETEVNGVDQDDRQRLTRMTVGTAWFVTPSVQLMANYARDLSVEEGFREQHRINLRAMKVF